MLQKIKINQIQRYSKDKAGNAYKTKLGKPFVRLSINAAGFDKSMSAMAFSREDEVMSWQEGQEVLVVITQSGEYLNVKLANRFDILEDAVEALKKRVALLEGRSGGNVPMATPKPQPEADFGGSEEVGDPFGEEKAEESENLPF